jgi:cell division protein FtsI (penicillin-binding protein 3)
MKEWQTEKRNDKPSFLFRFALYAGVLILAGGYILTRYGMLMLDPKKRAKVETPEYSRPVVKERGQITDRNGRTLALETKLGVVSLLKTEVGKKLPKSNERELDLALCKEISRLLSPILNMPETGILNLIRATPANYVVLKRNLEEAAVRKLNAAKAGVLDEETENSIRARYANDEKTGKQALEQARKTAFSERDALSKIRVDVMPGRFYPERRLASQIIGMVGIDNDGQEGIEYAFNNELRPNEKGSGSRVVLTIDANIQHFLEEIAEETRAETRAESVMLAAMDPQTGEILGAASIPDFDPNEYNDAAPTTWRFRPALSPYEPGSVFKIFTVASFLETKAITGDTTFVCNGHYGKVSPAITDIAAHGIVNAEKIIAYSCNVGVSFASERIENTAFYEKLLEFGFGNKIGSGSPSESAGIFTPPDKWTRRSKPTIAMGQEISVTMFQMLRAATAIANKGALVQPKLVLKLVNTDGTETPFPAEPIAPKRVLSERTASDLLRYMETTASSDGTGWRAAIGDIPMAVKTGTAQIAENGAYSERNFIASCLGVFPANDPELVLYVIIEKPQGESYLGGRIATIPIRNAAEALANYLKIPRAKNPVVKEGATVRFDAEKPLPQLNGVMPDFTGYSKLSLLPLFELNTGYYIELRGAGHVKSQTPSAGTPLIHGDTIILYLE